MPSSLGALPWALGTVQMGCWTLPGGSDKMFLTSGEMRSALCSLGLKMASLFSIHTGRLGDFHM
jgi:hypothetical protein